MRNSSATEKGTPRPAAGRGSNAPSTSRPILAKGLTTGSNLLISVTPPFLRCPRPNGAPARTTHGNGWLRLTFRHCRHCGDPGFARPVQGSLGSVCRSASYPHRQISGGSQDLHTTDTVTSPKPGTPPPDSLRTRPPADVHHGRLPSAWSHQSGQTGFGRQPLPYRTMLESARLQPVRLP